MIDWFLFFFDFWVIFINNLFDRWSGGCWMWIFSCVFWIDFNGQMWRFGDALIDRSLRVRDSPKISSTAWKKWLSSHWSKNDVWSFNLRLLVTLRLSSKNTQVSLVFTNNPSNTFYVSVFLFLLGSPFTPPQLVEGIWGLVARILRKTMMVYLYCFLTHPDISSAITFAEPPSFWQGEHVNKNLGCVLYRGGLHGTVILFLMIGMII